MEPIRIKKVFLEPVNIPLDEPFTIATGTKQILKMFWSSWNWKTGLWDMVKRLPWNR